MHGYQIYLSYSISVHIFLYIPPFFLPEKSHYLDEAEPCTITQLLLLLSDAGIVGTSEKPLSALLYPVTDTLGSVNTRAYMPLAKSERALQLLLLLLQMMESAEGGLSGPVETAVYGIAQQCGGEIYTFIRRRLTELSQVLKHWDIRIAKPVVPKNTKH